MNFFHTGLTKVIAIFFILFFAGAIIFFSKMRYDFIALTTPEVLVVDGSTRVNINYGNLMPMHETISDPVKVENAYNAILHLPHIAKDIEGTVTESTSVLPGFCNIAFGERYDLHFYKNKWPLLHAVWHPDGCPFVFLKRGDVRDAWDKNFTSLMTRSLGLYE